MVANSLINAHAANTLTLPFETVGYKVGIRVSFNTYSPSDADRSGPTGPEASILVKLRDTSRRPVYAYFTTDTTLGLFKGASLFVTCAFTCFYGSVHLVSPAAGE